jgi:hypothetical protein
MAAAPVLVAGAHLCHVYPIYGRQIEILGMVIFALAGFMQWYWIGWLLERQMDIARRLRHSESGSGL